jgi:hypothetical protein
VDELGQRVSSGCQGEASVLGDNHPEGFKSWDGNWSEFIMFVVFWLLLLFLEVSIGVELNSGFGLSVFL